jgi:hypothetical protein
MTGLEAMLLVGASTVVMLAWGLLADTVSGRFLPKHSAPSSRATTTRMSGVTTDHPAIFPPPRFVTATMAGRGGMSGRKSGQRVEGFS